MLLETLADQILAHKRAVPLRVGIDGIDAAGKTHLADELALQLVARGYPVLRASIDGFHHPRQIRHQRGTYSPEGYYYDSFNYELLKKYLLEPLGPNGNWRCRLKAFDLKTDSEIPAPEIQASEAHFLIFEGVFLFRREIEHFWDLKIFVEIDFQTSLQRALERDLELFGNQGEIQKRYQERYIPGQKIYLETEKPQTKADLVVDNRDFTNPRLVIRK